MELHFETITNLAKKLRSGEVTSLAITKLMLGRIDRYDKVLNAFITVTGELAIEQAMQADSELEKGHDKGPLHGIPIAIKDIFNTKGILTTCGSKLFENQIPDHDATVVTKLRGAGAVLLGKTGMHELAYGHTCNNQFFGPISNPWALDHHPGGSSGGSAAAVAGGLAYAALGTDTGCSIRQPAHCCGIVGYKPTFGLVSKSGVYPLVQSLDHVGPLTRNVEDTAHVLNAIAGYDHTDPFSVAAVKADPIDVSGAKIQGLRIGVIGRFFFEGYDDVIKVVDASLKSLTDMGAQLVPLDISDIDEASVASGETFAEALSVHRQNLKRSPQAFSDEVRAKLESSTSVDSQDYIDAQHFRSGFIKRMESLMSKCDVVAAPTSTITSTPTLNMPSDHAINAWKNTGIFNFTGQPSVSIPCGFTSNNLPVGLMLTGKLFEDQKVLQIANAIEQATNWYKKPPNF